MGTICIYSYTDLCSQLPVQKARASRVPQLPGAPTVSHFAFKTSRSSVLDLGLEARGLYIVPNRCPSIQDMRYVSKPTYWNYTKDILYSVGCIQSDTVGHRRVHKRCRCHASGHRPRYKVLRLKVVTCFFSFMSYYKRKSSHVNYIAVPLSLSLVSSSSPKAPHNAASLRNGASTNENLLSGMMISPSAVTWKSGTIETTAVIALMSTTVRASIPPLWQIHQENGNFLNVLLCPYCLKT